MIFAVRIYASKLYLVLTVLIGSVWVFHGLYSKILAGIPRHRLIVGRILGEEWAGRAIVTIGVLEILLGLWAFSGRFRVGCAAVQTVAIIAMNFLEIRLANDLLISGLGMLVLNAAFLSVVWYWAKMKPV